MFNLITKQINSYLPTNEKKMWKIIDFRNQSNYIITKSLFDNPISTVPTWPVVFNLNKNYEQIKNCAIFIVLVMELICCLLLNSRVRQAIRVSHSSQVDPVGQVSHIRPGSHLPHIHVDK